MKKIQCPFCDEAYTSIDGLYEHVEDEHIEDIPKDYSVSRYLYYLRTGKTEGSCVVCKKPTTWNETTKKYNRFCSNPKCKEKYRKMFEKRMIGKYGTTTLLNDPDQQRKMLEHRKISGKYEWSDGTKKVYTGTYELDFLKMLDVFLNFDSEDVMTPSPHTYYYIYEGEKKFYIPDAYIASLNLEVEVKQGGAHPNLKPNMVKIDKVKENLKDEVMKSLKDVDYIKVVDKDYTNFFEYLAKRKYDYLDAKKVNMTEIIREGLETIENIAIEGPIDITPTVKNAPISRTSEINDILNKCYEEHHEIWIATDWHLWKYDKYLNRIIKNPLTYGLIDRYDRLVKDGDVFIYLGDLVDDEFQDKESLKEELLKFKPGVKIFCRGNNDLFDDDFYISCGFNIIVDKFEWNDILFSHFPTENNLALNVHGHIHGHKEYLINYTNQIDAFRPNGDPTNLKSLLIKQKQYSNGIKIIKR